MLRAGYNAPTVLQSSAGSGSYAPLPVVLVVDDDPDILFLVRTTLERAGLEVWTAASAEQALDTVARRGLPALAVVDIGLPGIDGLELAAKLHAASDVPVVMLSAVSAAATVVAAIESVAEDYVVKPFNPRELAARVQRVLQRLGSGPLAPGPLTRIDERLALDFAGRRALIDGIDVPLSATEVKLLHVLWRAAGRVVPTESLVRRMWPAGDVFEDALRVKVHRLRQKLEPDPSTPRYLLTERGGGYRLVVK